MKITTDTSITLSAKAFVRQFLFEHLPANRLYHNYEHAREVAEIVDDLTEKAKVSPETQEMLTLAAWFHDTGYAHAKTDIAEESVHIAEQFLKEHNYPAHKTQEVISLIRNHHSGENPETLEQKILSDANFSFLGRKRFNRRGRLWLLEKEQLEERSSTLHDWNKELFDLLINYKFLTPWAYNKFAKRQKQNISDQRSEMRVALKKTTRKKTGKDLGRGVDTLYRITLRNHISLSEIADGKANMIISINTLVLSILITAGATGMTIDADAFSSNIRFAAPIITLMLTSLTAIILAVLSAIPKVSGEKFSKEDLQNHQVSMLFFGNFLKLKKTEFVDYLRDLKNDQEMLYDDMSRDLYNLGGILKKKYRLLTFSYRMFIGGLVLSFLVFLAVLLF